MPEVRLMEWPGRNICTAQRAGGSSLAHLSPACSGAAVAGDAVNAFVWLKACVSSKGRLVVFDVVAVYAVQYVGCF